jgi:predicted HTH transcriptional regulator
MALQGHVQTIIGGLKRPRMSDESADTDRERDDNGKFSPSRDPDDVLAAMDHGEPYTTRELADTLDWPRRSMYRALESLAASDKVRKKQTEPRRAIWILNDE